MSTTGDKKPVRRPRVSSTAMRERVMRVAALAFSRAGYDAVGVREIAVAADTDHAIVMRLFGSKAALFQSLAEAAFGDEALFDGPVETLGARLAAHLTAPLPEAADQDDVDDFQLLLRSATSVIAAPILSLALHRALIEPLGRRLGEPDGAARAAIVVAQVLGFATMRFALGSPPLEQAGPDSVTTRLARVIQATIDV